MVKAKTGQEVKNYYDKRYKEEQLAAMRPFEAHLVFLKYLNLVRGKKLLDVGCGTGYFLKAAEATGVETYGIDFSEQAVRLAKKIADKSKIFQDRAENLPFKDNFFDYVVCLGSLQYFPKMEKALKEMIRVAKDEAVFCLMVPNANFLLWKLRQKDKKILWGIEKNILTLNEWINFLERNGLLIKAVYKDQWFSQKIKIFEDKSPFQIIKRLLIKVGWLVLPSSLTYQHIFLCRKG